MRGQFVLNISIALLWVLISDEKEPQFTTFVWGYFVGVGVVFMFHRLFGDRFYLARPWAVFKLLLIFSRELLSSSILVIKQILAPKRTYNPGIFKYETQLEGDFEVTAISLLLTLTPGSVVMEVSEDERFLYIHAMDVKDSKELFVNSLQSFEKAIMEVTR